MKLDFSLSRRTVNLRLPKATAFGLFCITASVTFFVLITTTAFSIRDGFSVWALALLSTLPFGYLLLRYLAPGLTGAGERFVIAGVVGYAASLFIGFMVGVIGYQWLYLAACIAALIVWLGLNARRIIDGVRSLRSSGAPLRELLENKSVWIVASIGMLSVLAVLPFLAPLVRVTPDLWMNYADIDIHFHLIRSQLFALGAPLQTYPELAGLQPTAYPDWHDFWVGQLVAWSRADVWKVYLVYIGSLLVIFQCALQFVVGKQLTQSTWGGYLTAALTFLVFLPNPYDENLLLENGMNNNTLPAAQMHFVDFHSNLSFGSAWMLLSAITLLIALAAQYQKTRRGSGLLVLAGLLVVALARLRSHFFVIVAPVYFLICLWFLWRERRARYIVPVVVFLCLSALVFYESTRAYYNSESTHLALAFGVFGEYAFNTLPGQIQTLFAPVPRALRSIIGILWFTFFYVIGFAYSLLIAVGIVRAVRRRQLPTLPILFLYLVALSAIVLGSVLILEARRRDMGGAWGVQALFILPRVAMLLAVPPLLELLRSAQQKWKPVREHRRALACGALLVFTFIAYRGASATLYGQSNRAYPISASEHTAYEWIQKNTDAAAIVAALATHQVNPAGEMIRSTNLLSAMTQRAVFVERVEGYELTRAKQRMDVLTKLFASQSPAEIKTLIGQTNIDYLVVYSDTPTATDLSCCLRLVVDGVPQVYQVIKE